MFLPRSPQRKFTALLVLVLFIALSAGGIVIWFHWASEHPYICVYGWPGLDHETMGVIPVDAMTEANFKEIIEHACKDSAAADRSWQAIGERYSQNGIALKRTEAWTYCGRVPKGRAMIYQIELGHGLILFTTVTGSTEFELSKRENAVRLSPK